MTEITINKKDFIAAASIAGSFVAKNSTIPILECLKCTVAKGYLRMTSFDMENAISSKCKIENEVDDISFCLPYKEVANYVRLIPDSTFVLAIDLDAQRCFIRHNSGDTSFAIYPSGDYPQVSTEQHSKEFTISSAILAAWIQSGSAFVSKEDFRPTLRCIYFGIGNGKIEYCASDAQSLITENIPYDCGEENYFFLLNHNAFNPLLKALDSEGDVRVKVGEKNVTFVLSGGNMIMSRIVEGKYPPFHSVIPSSSNINVDISNDALSMACERALTASDATTSILRLSIGADAVVISAEDVSLGKKGTETVKCSVDNPSDMLIGLNGRRFIGSLNGLRLGTLKLGFTDPMKAILIQSDEKPTMKIVVMPVRLAN